jgi:DNA-binding LacI/PurR family transcriptional regulator
MSPGVTTCQVCDEIYDHKRKRYVVCGPSDNEDVIKAIEKLLETEPDAIIISEDVALNHRL